MTAFNKTQLYIDKATEREIVHRDYLAHCLRWTHILRFARMGQSILDVGCGVNTPLAMCFYTNKYKPALYRGLDLRTTFEKSQKDYNFPYELLGGFDITNGKDWESMSGTHSWNIVTCLEVIEHMPKRAGQQLLENLSCYLPRTATIFLSTPCFNGSKAGNHIYEWGYEELRQELGDLFKIEAHYGTFASQRDIIPGLTAEEARVFSDLKSYYDSNLISILLAPLHPNLSRNCIWRLRTK